MQMEKAKRDVEMFISVVLPAYNEEAAVGAQVEAIRGVLSTHGMINEIIVVDDGSEDQTAKKPSGLAPAWSGILKTEVTVRLSKLALLLLNMR